MWKLSWKTGRIIPWLIFYFSNIHSIFFPASYDLTSPQTLPTILTIHGGGFCIGTAKDDDEWNRKLSDSQNMLVISLPYQKAPRVPFPGGLYDLEALYLAVLGDESLPMDRTSQNNTRTGSKTRGVGRVAILGFDAGGNLALSLSQLPKIRHSPVPPTAVVSISGHLDLERSMNEKIQNRSYKPSLSFPRNATFDPLAATYSAYTWSYVPYGHDLRDPLLSPAFARWGSEDTDTITGGLPPHVCLVGAELDMLAHESWRMACRLVRDGGVGRGDGRTGRWRVPDADADDDALQQICGRRAPANTKGQLEFSDESQGQEEDGMDASKRFGFEVKWKGEKEEGVGEGSVKWILVPDVLHGFDRQWFSAGAEETLRDAELKTVAYVNAIGGWLRGTVWGM